MSHVRLLAGFAAMLCQACSSGATTEGCACPVGPSAVQRARWKASHVMASDLCVRIGTCVCQKHPALDGQLSRARCLKCTSDGKLRSHTDCDPGAGINFLYLSQGCSNI